MQKKISQKHVTLKQSKWGHTNLGKSAITTSTHVCIHFDEVQKIREYDIANTHFLSNGQMFKQTKGVPIGPPCSSKLAIWICACYKHLLMQKLRTFDFQNQS